jgi:putative transcriptional regulator
MTITHHPSDETLAAFASGSFDEARALVVAVHLSLCPQCRRAARAFAEVGGTMLDAVEPAAMGAGALERAVAKLDTPEVETASATVGAPNDMDLRDLPAPLSHYEFGKWRRIGPGLQWRPVAVASDEGTRVFMLKGAPGTRLLRHKHTGTEWTCVLQGAFRYELGRYGPGDFDEVDDSVEHSPVVEDGVTCICLVALQGTIALQGWIGRLLQPLIRI